MHDISIPSMCDLIIEYVAFHFELVQELLIELCLQCLNQHTQVLDTSTWFHLVDHVIRYGPYLVNNRLEKLIYLYCDALDDLGWRQILQLGYVEEQLVIHVVEVTLGLASKVCQEQWLLDDLFEDALVTCEFSSYSIKCNMCFFVMTSTSFLLFQVIQVLSDLLATYSCCLSIQYIVQGIH